VRLRAGLGSVDGLIGREGLRYICVEFANSDCKCCHHARVGSRGVFSLSYLSSSLRGPMASGGLLVYCEGGEGYVSSVYS
jgi:hypothetical protein